MRRKGMKLKEWAYLGNYEFYTNKLQLLATNELSPEKWSYAGKNDFWQIQKKERNCS